MESQSKILQHIMDLKRKEIVQKSLSVSTNDLENLLFERDSYRGFHNVIKECLLANDLCIIGDILRSAYCCSGEAETFDAAEQAKAFTQVGAHAISVATDKNFYHGKDEDVQAVRQATTLPVLRKEFIIDPYQVLETGAFGADCIILKAACLAHDKLQELSRLAKDIGLDVIIEIHSIADLDKLVDLPARMVSINNTNIDTNEVALETSMNLAGQLPKDYTIFSEGGIDSEVDVEILLAGGVSGIFVNACQNHDSPQKAFERLFTGQGEDSEKTFLF